MRKMDLQEIKKRTRSFEREWTAPFDGQLQRAVQIAGISAAAALPVSLFCVPLLASWAYSGFFWFLGDLSVGLLALLSSPVGIACNVVVLACLGLLWHQTQGLQPAPMIWHRTAFGLSVVGATDLLIIGMPVLIVALNLLVWAVVIGLALLLVRIFFAAAVGV